MRKNYQLILDKTLEEIKKSNEKVSRRKVKSTEKVSAKPASKNTNNKIRKKVNKPVETKNQIVKKPNNLPKVSKKENLAPTVIRKKNKSIQIF